MTLQGTEQDLHRGGAVVGLGGFELEPVASSAILDQQHTLLHCALRQAAVQRSGHQTITKHLPVLPLYNHEFRSW